MGSSETVASESVSPSRKSGAPRSLRNISKRDCSPVAPKPATMATRRKTKYFALGIRRLADSRNARPVPLPSSQDGSLEKSRESTIPATAAMDAPASPKAAWFPRNWTIVPPTSDPAPQPTAPHSLILPYSLDLSPRNRSVLESSNEEIGALRTAMDRATARADPNEFVTVMSCTGTMPTRIEATHACLWIWYLSTRTLIAGLTR
mmetsp:Transcript_10084/g.35808  ORF Transcript_10084/g.35808 Transcript_10084/m.35808 type:complete len:205 (-) Transcript_10084:392-1006(-)